MTKRKKTTKNKLPARYLRKRIISWLKENPDKSYSPSQIKEKLRIDNSVDSIQDALQRLVSDKFSIESKPGKYGFHVFGPEAKKDKVEGIVDMTKTGSAYIISDEVDADIFIPAKKLAGAQNKDRVEVLITRRKPGRSPEGRIVRVIKRVNEYVLAYIYEVRNKATAYTLGSHSIGEIQILLDDLEGAEEGDVAVLKIVQWADRPEQRIRGRVHSRIGHYSQHELEMLSILFKHGFTYDFPENVSKELEGTDKEISVEEIAGRRDFRTIPTITIDPDDAKDFDDALSIQFLDNGSREIGIHIADVSHFVRPDTALDKEAFKRATSVYLVGKVAPMLPEILSNDLCSLKPKVDRLTFSAVFTLDNDNRIIDRWFGKGIIHSDHRFSYREAQGILENREGVYAQEVIQLDRVAKFLRKKRFRDGSINFDSEEVKFELDKMGNTVEIYVKERLDAHMLVEELMLLANREVATYIHESGTGAHIPFVYRVHDEPDEQRVADFALLAEEMGFSFDIKTPKMIAKSFNRLMEKSKDSEELKLLEPLAIRTMAKAIYSTDNIGHYGLGFDYYTHFTSPIRRYSDILVHRILEAELQKRNNVKLYTKLEEQCKHISRQERAAMDAERESVKYKKVEYIERFIGKVFPGVVSGFLESGFFVELLENKCEGLVSFDQLEEPFYVAANKFTAMGRHTGKVIHLGQEVSVRIASADTERRQVDLELVLEN